jgi:hypothetical protein
LPIYPASKSLYQKIYDGLLPGGLFLNADAMFDETESNQKRKRWAAHLISAGFAEAEAFYHLQSWRKEDTYFGLETELKLLRKAGFTDCDVAWRYGPMAVIVGKKKPGIYKLFWPRHQSPDASSLLAVACSHIICRGRCSRVPHFYFLAKKKAITHGAIV